MKKLKVLWLLLAVVIAFGERSQAQEAYSVLNGGTLTLYYDNINRSGKYMINVSKYYPLVSSRDKVEVVRLDNSFKNYKPTSCAKWFNLMENLKEIQGLENLNTSEVTDMSSMFGVCSKLQSLDVSNFNTSNVTNMSSMFSGCSMQSLDVSNFNTSNVTNNPSSK